MFLQEYLDKLLQVEPGARSEIQHPILQILMCKTTMLPSCSALQRKYQNIKRKRETLHWPKIVSKSKYQGSNK